MEYQYCPNYIVCKLVNDPGFDISRIKQEFYIINFCKGKNNEWLSCKRFIVKNKINLCPDFVLPDTELSIDAIIDKFDE